MRALICDLDSTLFAPTSIPRWVLQPVFDAVFEDAPDFLARSGYGEGFDRPQ